MGEPRSKCEEPNILCEPHIDCPYSRCGIPATHPLPDPLATMDFWAIEVEGSKPYEVVVPAGAFIRLTHAALGSPNRPEQPVLISVKVGDRKLNLGFLSDRVSHISLDLLFDENVEFSLNSENVAVHLSGYQKSVDDGGFTNRVCDFYPVRSGSMDKKKNLPRLIMPPCGN